MKAGIQGKSTLSPGLFLRKWEKPRRRGWGKRKLKKMKISSNLSTVGRVSTGMWFVACKGRVHYLDNKCFLFVQMFFQRVIPTLNEYW